MSRERLVVLASSQVFKTQHSNVSVTQFAEKTGLSELWIKSAMFYDQMIAPCVPGSGGSYIDQYKAGNIEDAEFCNGIRYRLGVTSEQLPDERLKECWNAMCEFPETAKQQSRDFVQFLKDNPGYRVVFINETNQMQHEFNMRQFKEAVGEESFNSVAGRIHFVNSHELGILGKTGLIEHGLRELQEKDVKPQQVEAVVSLHREMPAASILQEKKFAAAASKRHYLDIPTSGATNIAEKMAEAHRQVEERKNALHIA